MCKRVALDLSSFRKAGDVVEVIDRLEYVSIVYNCHFSNFLLKYLSSSRRISFFLGDFVTPWTSRLLAWFGGVLRALSA